MKEKNNFKVSNSKYIKYPFSGLASNLIDKFLVLSYDQKIIEQTLQSEKEQENNIKNINLKYIKFTEPPTIMNEICFNYTKETQENDLVLDIIFPKYPRLIFLDKKNIKEQQEQLKWIELNKNYSIIFSINILDNSNFKKSYNGLGYNFYIKKEHRDKNNEIDGIIFYPMTYVILSEYPYFYHFNKICKNIYLQMKKPNDEIPIDIILYNTIKFCPSPINTSLNLSFGAQLSLNIKNEITANDILNQLNYKNNSEKISGIPSIFFNQLSGYPIMDINLSFIFNLLEPKIIIKTFILTFLEYDVIFLSSNPELLNVIIYIFANLNYPFNEQFYYFHVLSLSEFEFMNKFDSPFIGKSFSSLYGICGTNQQNYDFNKRVKDFFLLNIDEKTLSIHPNPNEPDQNTINMLMDLDLYINECLPETELQTSNSKESSENEINNKNSLKYFNDGINLYEAIHNLAFILNRRFRIVTNTNFFGEKKYLKFFDIYENESEMDMMRENLQLQKAFYNFIIQILCSYMSELQVEIKEKNDDITYSSDEYVPLMINLKNNKKEKYADTPASERTLACRAGLAFKELFQLTSKYSSFLINFCQHQDSFDVSKIPFTFINEFLYFSKIFPNYNLNSIDFFNLIDQFYGKAKKIDFIQMIKEKQEEDGDKLNLIHSIDTDKKIQNADNFKNIFNFSFHDFENYYKDNLRTFINREQEDDKINFYKLPGHSKQFKTYQRNNFYLSQKILNIYMNHLNNNFKVLQKCFNLTKCEYILDEKSQIKIKDDNKKKKIKKQGNIFNDFIIIENEEKQIKQKINKEKNKIDEYENNFGKYEIIEITDIIEKYLIKEKYFSSYEMIKFSLLSIVAVTINMKNKQINIVEVIRTLCDFCKITKSLVRKYMNIYLNIFMTMKLNNCLDKKICEECIKILVLYFEQTNTFPTEDTIKPIKKSEVNNFNEGVFIDYQSLNKFKTINKSIKEKRAEFYSHSRIKGENIVDIIETVFTGWYYISKNELFKPIANISNRFEKLYSALTKKKDKFVPKTPLELYASTNKMVFNFLSKFTIEKNEYIELGTIILSLLYYFKMEFLIPKWSFKVGNIKNVKNSGNNFLSNEDEIIKLFVTNIIYILLDLYEAILESMKK